jgi:cysteine desulfurase
MNEKLLFFDCQSTTPMDNQVIEEIIFSMKEIYGNPHSSSHKIGWQAIDALEDSRAQIAKVINADPEEIIFTSGATESNNMAIKGSALFYHSKGKHIITMTTEHKCVLESCHYLSQNNFEITYLSPQPDGLLDLEKLKAAIRPDTILISIMTVNNETGVMQDIKQIGDIARSNNILFHTDAAQAFGKMKIDVNQCNIDLMSISSHKIYGPKGIGALYIRKKPRVRLQPIMHGGGQERGFRSGTVPVPLAKGFAKAAELMITRYNKDLEYILNLQNKFLDEILKIEDCFLNGHPTQRIAGCVNISILHIEGESLMMSMPDICVSTGSACTSMTLEPSYVITEMRKDTYYAHSAIRFGFGRMTKVEDVDYLIKTLTDSINKLRSISPLWEMKKKGIDIASIQWDEEH